MTQLTKLASSVLLATAVALTHAQDDTQVSGKWNVHSSIAGNDSDAICTFAQTNNQLSGTCPAPDGSVKIAGKVEGKKVTWSYDIQYNGSPLTMKYEGTLDSGKIAGSVTVEQYGVSGDFTATQSTASDAPASPAVAVPAATEPAARAPIAAAGSLSLGGKWKVKGSIAGNAVNSECTFMQAGSDLTGTCVKAEGLVKVTGKVDGQKSHGRMTSITTVVRSP